MPLHLTKELPLPGESEFRDTGRCLHNLRVCMRSGVPFIRNEPVHRPDFGALEHLPREPLAQVVSQETRGQRPARGYSGGVSVSRQPASTSTSGTQSDRPGSCPLPFPGSGLKWSPRRLLKKPPEGLCSAGILPASVEIKSVAGWKPALPHAVQGLFQQPARR